MFAGKTWVLPRITNYAQAHAYFEKTKLPPRSRKWHHSQRPLKDTSSYHYRIEKSVDDTSYDLVLYRTVMARFHKPDAEGNELREYQGDGSQTSKGFMWNVLGVDELNKVRASSGEEVIMPIRTRALEPGMPFSVQAWFTPSNELMVAKSRHTRIYRKVSSPDDKKARAEARKAFDPLFTLAALQIPQFVERVAFDRSTGGIFRGINLYTPQVDTLRDLHKSLVLGIQPADGEVETFMDLAESVFDSIASRRAVEKGFLQWGNRQDPTFADIEPITEAQLIQSVWAKVQEALRLNRTNGYVEYPQFPRREQLVLSNIHTQ
jgi:hypothetical protein